MRHTLTLDEIPNHPAIEKVIETVSINGKNASHVRVTCPKCGKERLQDLSVIRKQIKKGYFFTGNCQKCASSGKEYGLVPDHPAIHKEIRVMTVGGRKGQCAKVTCPSCGDERWKEISSLRNIIRRQKSFTGLCLACLRNSNLSGRETNFDMTGIPDHPSIIREPIHQAVNGRKAVFLKVICSQCGNEKLWPLTTLRNYKSNFHGMCLDCWRNGGSKKYLRTSQNPSGKNINSLGYVTLNKNYFSNDELDWYVLMKGKGSYVFEHRWVMAKYLGRPLTTNELVDHQDGIKTNNSIENLRLYIRGKNQAGSSHGYGTYYHEWQMALVEIKKLKEKLSNAST